MNILRFVGVASKFSRASAFAAPFVATLATAAIPSFPNFETAPVQPLALAPDGRTLAVCNLPDARVELFDVLSGVPIPKGSVPVGLDPVTARFASANEVWVVNHISSTINIVDVAAQRVIATLETPAGPSDLVFAGQPERAWISCSRTNAVFVVDTATRVAVTNIPIDGERPRAMVRSPDGTKVYVAVFESGNGSTILGRRLTPLGVLPILGPVDDTQGPYAGADPPPNSGTSFSPPTAITNTPPRVSHIIRKNASGRWMDDNNADWTEWVSGTNASSSGRIAGWDLPDRDVALIDTATLEVSYANQLMNLCMALAVNPASGQIAVVGTDATNERRFEPVLNGVFLRVNLALVDPATGVRRITDLNPHLDYNTRTLPPEQRALGLGDPRGIAWNSQGTRAYITGMGSGNLIVVNANGERVEAKPIELGEGPTGLALDEPRQRLYVWNRFSSTISVVDTEAGAVVTNVPVFDPTPDVVRRGRKHLFDTRHNSGLGIVSCGSCHPDARMDRLAWDLGDPAGSRLTNGLQAFHPMKGPMVTQTLQDIITPTNFGGRLLTQQPLHWRGDRRNIEEFNPTFTALLARDTQLTTNEMADLKAMLASIAFPPNPLRTFSNSLPASVPLPGHFGPAPAQGGPRLPLPPGNPSAAQTAFAVSCRRCHGFSTGRGGITNLLLFLPRSGTEGNFINAQLRSLGDKLGMDNSSTNSRAGFGFMHDGRVDTLTRFLVDGFPETASSNQAMANLVAFLLCFTGSDLSGTVSNPSQDVPAAVGRQITLATPTPPPLLEAMLALALRTNSRVELVLRGNQNGHPRQWLLRRTTQRFQANHHETPAAVLTEVIAEAAPGNEFTATLVPEGSGVRLALDRDGDGYFDASELETGFDPEDPSSHPGHIASISKIDLAVTLTWISAPGARYAVEWRSLLPGPNTQNKSWTTLASQVTATTSVTTYTDTLPETEPQRFYRVRMEP